MRTFPSTDKPPPAAPTVDDRWKVYLTERKGQDVSPRSRSVLRIRDLLGKRLAWPSSRALGFPERGTRGASLPQPSRSRHRLQIDLENRGFHATGALGHFTPYRRLRARVRACAFDGL